MASTLVNVALSGMRPAHATYYGEVTERNPVIVAFNKEVNEFCKYIAKLRTPGYEREENEAFSRDSNWLFDIWNKYNLRLPTEFFHKKIIEIGDRLCSMGSFDIGLHQCYDYFLKVCHGLPVNHAMQSAVTCRKSYFKNGLGTIQATITSQALLGSYTCRFHVIQKADPDFLRPDSSDFCLKTLKGLQTFMQCIQKYEPLCWMLYNCTIIMYQMCRKLMACNNSAKALEYLIWAAMCMEGSVPLMAVHYLTWRVTLYSAVCLAYYDCKSGQQAEHFARRSLTKLQELSELEFMSQAPDSEMTRLIFQQATVKMAAMVFKRTVFESRRKPKGMLRPKMRNNLKDAAQLTWPRTNSEKLISDMFIGSAAQFLAVLEALNDRGRRSLYPRASVTDTETEILDVYAELFFAGKEIVGGGGGTRSQNASGAEHSVLAGIRLDKSLIQLAAAGLDGVTLVSIIRFTKLAFCYEQWDTFNTLLDSALLYIKKTTESGYEGLEAEYKGQELCLALLLVMERVIHTRSSRKIHTTASASADILDDRGDAPLPTQGSVRIANQASDDLVNLAETVFYCISDPSLFRPMGKDSETLLDRDMILDACNILWKRCRAVLSRIQNSTQLDAGISQKWIHLLQIIHSCFIWCGISAIDPAILAEVSLRLALLLESYSDAESSPLPKDVARKKSQLSMASGTSIYQSKSDRLASACQVLSDAIDSLCEGRTLKMSFDGKDVSDTTWMKDRENSITPDQALIRDLHVEMLNTHHRIALKLFSISRTDRAVSKEDQRRLSRTSVAAPKSQILPQNYSRKKLNSLVGGNLVSNAILYMQKANIELSGDADEAKSALEKATSLLLQAEEEEKRLYNLSHSNSCTESFGSQTVPPPPILVARSNSSMVFKPGNFHPDKTVAWYRLFGRTSAGANVKVRLNDYFLEGAGRDVPAGTECIFRVDGLHSNQRYVFAVAAYSASGTLIGGSIGATSEVIPAHHPLSILTSWSLLAEVSYNTKIHSVARTAVNVLWNHFVSPPLQNANDNWTTSIDSDFKLSLHHLQKHIKDHSPVLLRHVTVSIFIATECAIQEAGLFCDKVCDNGPLLKSQIQRLEECEKMLVAMELAGYLNDPSYLLQGGTQCFGLLVPLMQSDVYSVPVVQILTRCQVALREACSGQRSQRSPLSNNDIHHMIASITYYLAKVLRSWGRSDACLSIIESGKLLLNPTEPNNPPPTSQRIATTSDEPTSIVNVSQAKKRGIKPVSTFNTNMSQELGALEERLAELTKLQRSADELTGSEDASTVLAYITAAKPMIAYKEIGKFRRRSRYLEYFVHVLRKAMHAGLVESAIEWAQDVLMWLRRRNETLCVNHTLMSIQNGAVVVQGNDPSKYAAVVAAYSQDKKKAPSKKKKQSMKGDNQEELERKALGVLEQKFIEVYKNAIRRRKLRKVSQDEFAWRSEFNHLIGLLHYEVFVNKLDQRQQLLKGPVPVSKNEKLLDRNLWALDSCGSVILQPKTSSRRPFNVRTNVAIEADEDEPGQALLRSAKQAMNALFEMGVDTEMQAQLSPDEDSHKGINSPRTQRTNSPISVVSTHTLDPGIATVQNNVIIETLKISFLSFRRALVLAHRNKCWILLQNIARSLLYCLSEAFENSVNIEEPIMSDIEFRHLAWLPMSLATDFLLDMLFIMQECKSEEWLVDSYAGDSSDGSVGSNLWFDPAIDDSHSVDFPMIKSLVLRTIQVQHFESRWEHLVDVCLRFSALTHDKFSENINPIMIHAQHEIAKRVTSYSRKERIVSAFNEKEEKIILSNRNYITARLHISPMDQESASGVNIGGYIDPKAHDVYGGGRDALALPRVPFDIDESLSNLHKTITKSKYMSRALLHSRKLLGLYLSSQHNTKEGFSAQGSASQDQKGSSVSFVDVQTKNQQPFPPDMFQTDFCNRGDVEMAPFAHLPTVIESYTKTLELLASHKKFDLVAQASHELGNLYLHSGNMKAAFKSWNMALDNIFGLKQTLTQWYKCFNDSKDLPQDLLEKLGTWGCLLAIIIVCKIGEFTISDTQSKTDCAQLAAELVRALFRVSLPHPAAEINYKAYEIFPQPVLQTTIKPSKFMPGATALFPNVDLFADQYRCEVKQLMSASHWLCQTLVEMQFNLKALPCLVLYQYLATFVCKDVQRSVQCRCIKLTALTNIRCFDVATSNICALLFGSKLPHPIDHTYREPESNVPNIYFNLSQSIESLDNLKAMEIIASKRLSPSLSQLYGPHLTCEVTIQQSRLLSEMAECIICIPQRPTIKDLQFVSPDTVINPGVPLVSALPGKQSRSVKSQASDDVRSTISALSTSSSYGKIKKLFSKRDSPMTKSLLKGILLAVSEALASALLNPMLNSNVKLTAGELWVAVQSCLILSQIALQRQHSTIAASKALKGLNLLQESDLFEDARFERPRQINSAMKNRSTKHFTDRGTEPEDERKIENIEQTYRVRLNTRLWLQARLQLCMSLLTQIIGLGKVSSSTISEEKSSGHTQIQLYCAEGLVEAEACNDVEMQALFLLQGSLASGLSSEEAKRMLEDAVATLDELAQLSDVGTAALVHGTVSIADLQLQCHQWTSSHAVQEIHNAHAIMLLHAMQHGETICHSRLNSSSIDIPVKNLYLKDLMVLSHLKLRMGHANYFTLSNTSSVEDWQVTLEILKQAKALCECSMEKDSRLLAEINLSLGKVYRALYFMNGCLISAAETALQHAIKACHVSDHTTERYGNLELAMLGISLNTEEDSSAMSGRKSGLMEISKIASSLHTAYSIAQADLSRSLLPGNTAVTSLTFSDEDKHKLPDFVNVDISSTHDEIPLSVTTDDITLDPVVLAMMRSSGSYSWIHILHYRVLLLRQFGSSRVVDDKYPSTPDSEVSSVEDFYPSDLKKSDQGSEACKTPMFSTYLTIRLGELHEYMKGRLPAYAETCNLPPFDTKAAILLVQWYRVRHKMALLWCRTDTQQCGKLLISPSDISRLLIQIKALLQKVEIYFGQTMAPVSKLRSRNIKQRKPSSTPQIPTQLEDDTKQTLTNASLLITTDHDVITTLPFQVTVHAIEHMVKLFTIGCCYTSTDPLYDWLSNLMVMSLE